MVDGTRHLGATGDVHDSGPGGTPPPHERTPEELRAFYPEPGLLERLFLLKERVDPDGLFDGAGTIPTRSVHVGYKFG